MKISGIIIASGKSSRFHSNKLLYAINGKPLISYVLENVYNASFYERIIVLRNKEIEKISKAKGYKIAWNRDYEKGMSSSIICGIKNVSEACDSAMVMPGDMPLLKPEYINALIKNYEMSGTGISGFIDNETIISPVIFSRKYFKEILTLKGDKGAKSIVMNNYEDFSPMKISSEALMDIDTPEDAAKFEKLLKNKD
jgi:molybdenum cofactor cytidylyltransferase